MNPSGLINIGNTCYMNAMIQCLYHTKDFITKEFISDLQDNIQEKSEKKLSKPKMIEEIMKSMTYGLFKLSQDMSSNEAINPVNFKRKIDTFTDMFRGFRQHDSHELLIYLLNQIHDETKCDVSINFRTVPKEIRDLINMKKRYIKIINDKDEPNEIRKNALNKYKNYIKTHQMDNLVLSYYSYWSKYINNNYSSITKYFTGNYLSTTKCMKCESLSTVFESFNTYQIPILPQECSIYDCIKNYSKSELLTGENKYRCDNCEDNVDAEKNIYLWDLPKVLIIQLKRFLYNIRSRKINSRIIFPLEDLDMDQFMLDSCMKKGNTYNLYGLICHQGGCSSGHYFACCKVNDMWLVFNDNSISRIPDEKVEEFIVSPNAYILFYRRN